MDLSKWNDYSEEERQGYKMAIAAAVQNRHMPPSKYLWVHRESRLSSNELELVKEWALARRKAGTNAAP